MTKGQASRRSYGQFCGLARALDVVGDRWTLLVVRELLIGPRRFGALQQGLPGVASNLLAERLRQLEQDGVVARALGEPGTGTRYALTPRGAQLRDGVEALIRWSSPLMVSGRAGQEARASWLAVALPALLRTRPRRRSCASITTCGEDLLLEAGPNGVQVTVGRADSADAALVAEPEIILGLGAGALDLRAARRLGARVSGDVAALASIFEARALRRHAARASRSASPDLKPPRGSGGRGATARRTRAARQAASR